MSAPPAPGATGSALEGAMIAAGLPANIVANRVPSATTEMISNQINELSDQISEQKEMRNSVKETCGVLDHERLYAVHINEKLGQKRARMAELIVLMYDSLSAEKQAILKKEVGPLKYGNENELLLDDLMYLLPSEYAVGSSSITTLTHFKDFCQRKKLDPKQHRLVGVEF